MPRTPHVTLALALRDPQVYCIMNTVVALLGACLAAFTASAAFEGKFNMVREGSGGEGSAHNLPRSLTSSPG